MHVADRDKAAAWYLSVIGLQRDETLAVWASDPDGPLMLSSVAGQTRVALFAKDHPEGIGGPARSVVAFRVPGADFMQFLADLDVLHLDDGDGRVVGAGDLVDHGLAWSLYFCDPDGNPRSCRGNGGNWRAA